MTDTIGLWAMAGASLLVFVGSAIVVRQAKARARKIANLAHRTEAINYLRSALFEVTKDGFVIANIIKSIAMALHPSELVFSRKLRQDLDRAYRSAYRLNKPLGEPQADHDAQDIVALGKTLQTLIARMNEEASLP